MFGYVEAPKAWWLTYGMARAAGVNLPAAVVDGVLRRAELADIVLRCQECGNAAKCAAWLSDARAAAPLPAFCPNKAALEALAPLQ